MKTAKQSFCTKFPERIKSNRLPSLETREKKTEIGINPKEVTLDIYLLRQKILRFPHF